MKFARATLAACLFVAIGAARTSAITITFDYSFDANNFFDTQIKKDLLNAAANTIASHLSDSLTAITPNAPSNTWTASFFNPATGSIQTLSNLSIPADTVVVYAGGRNLGTSTLGSGGHGGFGASGSQEFVDTVTSRGQGVTQGAAANDFGPWGGAVTFTNNAAVPWSFANTQPPGGQFDFFSVALHELTHLFGFGTTDSWDNLVSGSVFVGFNAVAANGGLNVPLSADHGHWVNGTTSDGRETAMDPSLSSGARKGLTTLDLAGLDDLGWTLVPTGTPGNVNHDGRVDISDIQTVAANWLTPGPGGDANGNSFVDISDIQVIAAHWLEAGGAGGGAVLAVPEPSTLLLAAVAGFILAAIGVRARRNAA
ncbi:MAG: PEP-CTERM sorting domain-containing protein [Planctomycetia bacterium]|nr:PEP-CTERM sorting domain-containing protein [Planctomycetia bacterium]